MPKSSSTTERRNPHTMIAIAPWHCLISAIYFTLHHQIIPPIPMAMAQQDPHKEHLPHSLGYTSPQSSQYVIPYYQMEFHFETWDAALQVHNLTQARLFVQLESSGAEMIPLISCTSTCLITCINRAVLHTFEICSCSCSIPGKKCLQQDSLSLFIQPVGFNTMWVVSLSLSKQMLLPFPADQSG